MSEETASRSTGPRTEQGKAISAQNARKTGLFATRDFIRPEEQHDYEELRDSLHAELSPEGVLERHIAAEILRAVWRLHRCAQLESQIDPTQHDPLRPDDPSAKLQLSIDRARNQATRLLHRNTAELRRLQTERRLRTEISAAGIPTNDVTLLCDFHAASSRADRVVKSAQRCQYDELKTKLDTLEIVGRANTLKRIAATREDELTKRTPPPVQESASAAESTPPGLFRKAA